jgi:hypothetical protein
VLLYFIVQVEVVEIQIGFEFKLICNLQNRIEKEKEILNWKSASDRIRRGLAGLTARAWPARPSRPTSRPSGFTGAHHIADPNLTR